MINIAVFGGKPLSGTPALAAAEAPPALKECVLNREISGTISLKLDLN